MNTNYERLGIGFCCSAGTKRVPISPGVALLLKGSTTKTSMKRKKYDAISELEVAGLTARVIRKDNKIVLLLDRTADRSQFTQACELLKRIADSRDNPSDIPRIISLDAMTVEFDRGGTADYIGCVQASKHHEVVVYENRNQKLDFLKPLKPPQLATVHLPVDRGLSKPMLSGSEKLEHKLTEERKGKNNSPKTSKVSSLIKTISAATLWVPHTIGKRLLNRGTIYSHPTAAAVEEFFRQKPLKLPVETDVTQRTKADKGLIQTPKLKKAEKLEDHFVNAFKEFVAINKATKEIKTAQCKKILQALEHQNEGLLKVRLDEAEGTIYNNDTLEVIKGYPMTRHMAAYHATTGIIPLDLEETRRTGKTKYQSLSIDPIVVTTKGTEIWLEDKILEKAHSLSESDPPENWEVPKITWVNGVPGCGKTTWIVENFKAANDVVATATREAKRDLIEKITRKIGVGAINKIRTIASILANGASKQDQAQCRRLLVDEALMNHFGSIVMVSRVLKAKELLIIGDINQVPYIDRDNLFKLTYLRPDHLATISQELLCTHRCPMDVAFALQQIYKGIFSSSNVTGSLSLSNSRGAEIPKDLPETLYLTFTQAEKESLADQGYGTGNKSKLLTIHEAQGLSYGTVVIIKETTKRLKIHDSVTHAVVAISRHTKKCVYYTLDSDDAIGHFIKKANSSTTEEIVEHNLRMAIHNRDDQIMDKLAKIQPGQAHYNG